MTPAGATGLDGLAAEPRPARPARRDLASVLAVPSAPLAYHVVENEDFDRATAWTMDIRAFSPCGGRGGGIGGSGSGGLAIGETVNVGEYAVTPIEAEGDAGATELNRWLRTNRFPEAKGDAVDAYAREGPTFLAVKVRLPARFASANLRPLAIAFRSEQIVLPVRLSAGEDPFGMKVTVVSTRVPDYSTALTHGLSARSPPPSALSSAGATARTSSPASTWPSSSRSSSSSGATTAPRRRR